MSAVGRAARVIETQEGIKILPEVLGAPGVETPEGRFGPLLNAKRGGAHYVEVPAGAYMDDHAHERESLIYTVRGQWVLCSRGSRWHMKEGDLFWFGDGVPTGYENPFTQPAFLLIFKVDDRTPGYDAAMLDRLERMRGKLEEEHSQGTPFLFKEIPEDHPAKMFARTLPGTRI
ncbi:MAG TPA: AraC family ligand binding domain-containing protein [Candidatus Limnocylindria bacterium]|nr:AraC family ligand binding domain-containing protein [Candidatus Limnocylindria bacterium]